MYASSVLRQDFQPKLNRDQEPNPKCTEMGFTSEARRKWSSKVVEGRWGTILMHVVEYPSLKQKACPPYFGS